MRFSLDYDERDGLVFIDKSYMAELDDDRLYAMDILLDPLGKTELIFDFPGEGWETVRPRETKIIREFCESGKMIVWLFDGREKKCPVKEYNEAAVSPK